MELMLNTQWDWKTGVFRIPDLLIVTVASLSMLLNPISLIS